jgi:2-oxoglutarate ferredoxin oxidoreductase subunit alpha
MVALNPETWDQDVTEIEPGGYLFYDSTKPMPRSKFRTDFTVIGMPLMEMCNAEYTDIRQRQLFKNIMCLGGLAQLLAIDARRCRSAAGGPVQGQGAAARGESQRLPDRLRLRREAY